MKLVTIRLTIMFAFVMVFIITLNAQNRCYWPDGKPFITSGNTIQSFLDSTGISTYHSFRYKSTEIFYYSLSEEPAFIISGKRAEISEALKSYNHNKFINSQDFEKNIKEMIKKSALDTTYALEVLGKPIRKYAGNEDYSQYWLYDKLKLNLKFEFQNAVSFEILAANTLKEYLSFSNQKSPPGSFQRLIARPRATVSISLYTKLKSGEEYLLLKVDSSTHRFWVGDKLGKPIATRSYIYNDNSLNKIEFEECFWSKSEADRLKKKYGSRLWYLILDRDIRIGWSEELCLLSWAAPEKINSTTTANGEHEQWIYDDSTFLYFDNGKLTAIQRY